MSLPVCKFFSSAQTCKFGKHCRYLHPSQRPPFKVEDSNLTCQNEELSVAKQSQTSVNVSETSTSRSEFHHHENGAFLSGGAHSASPKDSGFQAKPHTLQREKSLLCSFYAYGCCRYGKSCRYAHESPRGPRPSNRGRGKSISVRQELPPRFQNKSAGGERSAASEEVISGKESSEQVTHVVPPSDHKTPSAQGRKNGRYQPSQKSGERRVCQFYKNNGCNRGQRCRYLHPTDCFGDEGSIAVVDEPKSTLDSKENQKENVKAREPSGQSVSSTFSQRRCQINRPAFRPPAVRFQFTYEELEEVGSSNLKEIELNYIKKRFTTCKTWEEEKESFTVGIIFAPSDPDWPFDIKSFPLTVTLPPDYPKSMLTVTVPADQDLPETVRRYLEVSIQEWLEQKEKQLKSAQKVELVFRSFLRWLDRSVEEVITGALIQLKRELTARAAGLEFIPAQKLQAKFKTKSESSGEVLNDEEMNDSDEENNDGDDDDEDDDDDGSEDSSEEEDLSDSEEDEGKAQSLDLDPQKKGTEIALKNLQLKEKAAALTFQRLKIVIQCGRCKNHADLIAFAGKVMSSQCAKCSQNQYVVFRPALTHQFSSIIGYLDVDGCQAFDLVLQDCQAVISCMACSKQTSMNGLVSGQLIDGWCRACNARFKLAIESVKFSQLVPSGIDTTVNKVVKVVSAKNKRAPKDPRIKEGCPLPEFGACKHYKHSYRWLRFPCCGKAYPCDVCHDKHEDHEMQFANRMICGHCCKEQNYSASRPCQSCNQHLTKIRSAHWEGGSGCRDKITMSKNDSQKYHNQNKTVSNHKKKVQAGSKKSSKKNTKLRHA